nr:unnamed protein product [Digitaria exilis]
MSVVTQTYIFASRESVTRWLSVAVERKVFDIMAPCTSNQENPWRLGSRMTMGFSDDASGELFPSPACIVFSADVLGVILGFLQCFAGRSSRHWRSVGRSHIQHGMQPPLPLLVLPRPNRELHQVQVFVLDFSTNPCGLTEIHNFDGDCVFVDSCGCNSFPASLYDGAEGDRFYFVDQYSKYDVNSFDPSYDTFVYTVRNGRTRPLATELSPDNFGAPNGNLDVPLLLLTSK